MPVVAPYRSQRKSEIIARFPELPLELTLTCIAPTTLVGALVHCGACNKCEERRRAFGAAGVRDKTRYLL
jgi:7-cyano-7-deazaguanine synthase